MRPYVRAEDLGDSWEASTLGPGFFTGDQIAMARIPPDTALCVPGGFWITWCRCHTFLVRRPAEASPNPRGSKAIVVLGLG